MLLFLKSILIRNLNFEHYYHYYMFKLYFMSLGFLCTHRPVYNMNGFFQACHVCRQHTTVSMARVDDLTRCTRDSNKWRPSMHSSIAPHNVLFIFVACQCVASLPTHTRVDFDVRKRVFSD